MQCGLGEFGAHRDLSGTALARLRHKSKWLAYLDCMLQSATVPRAAAAVSVHKNTSFRWRHRFLHDTKHDRSVPLAGITEVDETYLLESQKGSRRLTRPARRRGGRARRRGISHEHDCILVARDRSGRTVDFVTGRAPLRPTCTAACRRWWRPISCWSPTAMPPIAALRARPASAIAPSTCPGVRVAGALHVQNVNAYHSRFKQWLRGFNGVASRYLPNYLGWRWALDNKRISLPEALLRSALGSSPT